jgi:alpha-glucuronidase
MQFITTCIIYYFRIITKIRQYFCRHNWKCVYIYNIFADWRCTKCDKHKKGYAPFGLTQDDINKEIIDRLKKERK